MPDRRSRPPARRVREPIQVYLAPDERKVLDQLAEDAGVSRAEVLRRGISALAREGQPWQASPVLAFIRQVGTEASAWPEDLATDHDRHLADEARGAP